MLDLALPALLLGVLAGFLSGLFGIGGAVISQPGLRLLGAAPLVAVGTTLLAVLPGALTGTIRYHRSGLLDWRVVAWAGVPGAVVSVTGALLSARLPGDGRPLLIATAGIIGVTAWRLSRRPRDQPPAGVEPAGVEKRHTHALDPDTSARPELRQPPGFSRLRVVLLGTAAGGLSGLLGIGGGVLLLPGFVELVGLPLRRAIAASLACVGLLALPSLVTHALLGHVDWTLAFWLAAGVVPGAMLGAALTIRLPERPLRLVIATGLAAVAVFYAAAELMPLLRDLAG